MTFEDVINDLKKLERLTLQSIKPGSEIIILKVDDKGRKIEVSNKQDKVISRSLKEIETIWKSLSTNPAVHVDGVLQGSGSSRNQPETILANLPYIEWLMVNNKKHIAFVGYQSHVYGTIRKMDAIESEKLKSKMMNIKPKMDYAAVIVTDQIIRISRYLGTSSNAINKGIYSFNTGNQQILLVLPECCNLIPGTYLVIESPSKIECKTIVEIADHTFGVITDDQIKILVNMN